MWSWVVWSAVALSVVGLLISISLLLTYLVHQERFNKRTNNILSLLIGDAGYSLTHVLLLICPPSQVSIKGINVIGCVCLSLLMTVLFHLSFIIITRLVACAKPFRYKHWVTRRRVTWTIITSWAIGVILVAEIFLQTKNLTGTKDSGTPMLVDVLSNASDFVLVCLILALCFIVVLLLGILSSIKSQLHNYNKRKNKANVTVVNHRELKIKEYNAVLGGRNKIKIRCNTVGSSDITASAAPALLDVKPTRPNLLLALGKRRDYIHHRHSCLILWTVVLLLGYVAIFIGPILYTIALKFKWRVSVPPLRSYCLFMLSLSTIINSLMLALPMIKQKVRC